MQDWGCMESAHLIYGIWLLQFWETRIKVLKHLTRFKNASNLREWSMIWIMLILFLKTPNFLIRKFCCMCLKTAKQWSRLLSKAEVLQWDMFPKPTEFLLVGCSIESIWTPNQNQIHWHQKPTRRHIDKRQFHAWWMESSFVFAEH